MSARRQTDKDERCDLEVENKRIEKQTQPLAEIVQVDYQYFRHTNELFQRYTTVRRMMSTGNLQQNLCRNLNRSKNKFRT